MPSHRLLWLLPVAALPVLLIFLFIAPGCRQTPAPAADPAPYDGPRLAVLLIFDQLRGDYLTRWQPLFAASGFRRLQTEGATFPDCNYPFADTVTAAGHASIVAGCSPAEHGIIGNEWYDRTSGELAGCVAAGRYQRLPPVPGETRPAPDEPRKVKPGISPSRLLAPTLADALKEATGGKGRIVSLSLKDRSAVLPGGRRPDACYWFDPNSGQFVTSTYYRSGLHAWVSDFNQSRQASRWFDHNWTRLRPDLEYPRFSGPDDVAGEGTGFAQGRTFPHPMTGGQKTAGNKYYQALINSPFGNELLFDLVKRAIDAERLGHGPERDLLCVSFSANDLIGHCWGPDSQEVLDVTLRTDELVAKLLAHLDEKVGRDNYVLALTSDHGICPLPEVSRAQGKDAGRLDPGLLRRQAEAFLNEKFGQKGQKDRWLDAVTELWVYLNQRLLRDRGLEQKEVESALAGWLKQQPGILTAYTRTQLGGEMPAEDTVGQRVQRSFHAERSGDVAVVVKPYYLLSWPLGTGTTHGTPHPYDTHVPLLVYGPGIRAGVNNHPTTPLATAAILATALKITAPTQAKAPVPEELFATP
jgi:hypothetical protein